MHHFVAVVVATRAIGAYALELFWTLAGESEQSHVFAVQQVLVAQQRGNAAAVLGTMDRTLV